MGKVFPIDDIENMKGRDFWRKNYENVFIKERKENIKGRQCVLSDKEYIARRGILGVSVRVANGSNMYHLPSYDDNFNADDFDWGFDGRRQDQLAISILYDFMGTSIAKAYHKRFAKEILGNMPVEGFVLSGYMIQRWIKTRQRVSIVV